MKNYQISWSQVAALAVLVLGVVLALVFVPTSTLESLDWRAIGSLIIVLAGGSASAFLPQLATQKAREPQKVPAPIPSRWAEELLQDAPDIEGDLDPEATPRYGHGQDRKRKTTRLGAVDLRLAFALCLVGCGATGAQMKPVLDFGVSACGVARSACAVVRGVCGGIDVATSVTGGGEVEEEDEE